MARQTAKADGDRNIVVQNTGSHVVIQVGTQKLEALSHSQYLSSYQSAGERGLLIAQAQGIPFYLPPRENDLLHLRDWLDQPNPISIRTLLGRAGTGKTRTAVEFVNREQHRKDWHFGWLTAAELKRFVEHASLAGKIFTGNTCLILDYASASLDALQKLLHHGLIYAGEGPGRLRLLLLDRSEAGWYETLLPLGNQKAAVQALFAANDPRRLSPFVNLEHRRHFLASAVAHFGASKTPLTLPEPGQDPIFDQRLANSEPWAEPLFLLLAAAASAHHGLHRSLSMSRTELARFAAGHEADRLERILPGKPLRHLAALVTLAGGASVTQAREAAKAERERLGWSLAVADLEDKLKIALPGTALSQLGKIEPDIIGEAFLLDFFRTIPEEEAAVLEVARAMSSAGTGQTLVHTIQNFALGAGAQVTAQDPAEQAERTRRAEDESLLVRLLSEYLDRCEAPETGTLWAILDAISSNPHPDSVSDTVVRASTSMAGLALSICQRLQRLLPPDDPAGRLQLMNHHGIWLSALGKKTEALAISRREVDLYRELAAAHPEAFRPALAGALNNQATLLSALGQRAEALAAIDQAVELDRELAAAHPEAFRPALAMSLNNQATLLSALGQRAEALAAINQAVELDRELAAAHPEAFRPALAMSLNNQATLLSALGQRAEALAAINQAVEIRRELTAAHPEAFRPDLAGALNNQANRLSELGHRAEALAASNQAVEIRRELTAAHPEAFRPDLASALNDQANRLSELGQRAEALAAINQAVDLYRELAAAHPEAFRPELASALNNQASRLSELGHRAEALAAIDQAVEIRRELAAAHPDRFAPNLATSCGVWGQILWADGQGNEAADVFAQGLAALLPLLQAQPAAVGRLFIQLLTVWGSAGRELGLARSDQPQELLQQFLATLNEPTPGEPQ